MTTSPPPAPTWLVQARLGAQADAAAATAAARGWADAAAAQGLGLTRAAWRGAGTGGPGAEVDTGLLYVYLHAVQVGPLTASAPLARALAAGTPSAAPVLVSPLEPAFGAAGASAGDRARFHYVVETDPEAGWHDEIVRWYDEEHMPGLAAVPGCVGARRAINRGAGPWSLACYDLVDRDVPETAPWLAVRGTAWSSRTRPHFTNTRRTMFEVIA